MPTEDSSGAPLHKIEMFRTPSVAYFDLVSVQRRLLLNVVVVVVVVVVHVVS